MGEPSRAVERSQRWRNKGLPGSLKAVQRHNEVKQRWDVLNEAEGVETSQRRRQTMQVDGAGATATVSPAKASCGGIHSRGPQTSFKNTLNLSHPLFEGRKGSRRCYQQF